jgi:small subunit ribosomal protein S6
LETTVKRLYEAMFLVDSTEETDWGSTSSTARKILEKAGAEIVSMKKWDERKLTYKINGRDRGTYILCYFHADGQKIRQIERDARLSEKIMRVLILATSGRDKEDIERDIMLQGPKESDEVKANLAPPTGRGLAKAGESRAQSILSKTESVAAADEGGEIIPSVVPTVKKRRTDSRERETRER